MIRLQTKKPCKGLPDWAKPIIALCHSIVKTRQYILCVVKARPTTPIHGHILAMLGLNVLLISKPFMNQYKVKKFNIPSLEDISDKQIEEHLKLYKGYVTHTNTIFEQVTKWITDDMEGNKYVISELWRRLGFEFDGMRNHEYYFGALEGGKQAFNPESAVGKAIVAHYGSYDSLYMGMKFVASTRGSGWAMLYYDPVVKSFIGGWVDEHHLGALSTLPIVLAIDCWEHAYMVDHTPGERGVYVDAYLNNVNWKTVDEWFRKIGN